jgi:hypothetical protein
VEENGKRRDAKEEEKEKKKEAEVRERRGGRRGGLRLFGGRVFGDVAGRLTGYTRGFLILRTADLAPTARFAGSLAEDI